MLNNQDKYFSLMIKNQNPEKMQSLCVTEISKIKKK